MKKESTDKERGAENAAEELRRKEKQEKDRDNQERDASQENPEDPPSTSGDIITRGYLPFADLGLVPFTPSKQNAVASLDKVVFDLKRKSIVRRVEKKLKVGTQPEVTTVTERPVMKGTDEDLPLMASIGVAAAQANAYNVGILKETVDQYKEKMERVKDTLMK